MSDHTHAQVLDNLGAAASVKAQHYALVNEPGRVVLAGEAY